MTTHRLGEVSKSGRIFFSVMSIASKIGIEIFDAAPLPHFAYSYNTGIARLYIFTRQELSSSEGKISRQNFVETSEVACQDSKPSAVPAGKNISTSLPNFIDAIIPHNADMLRFVNSLIHKSNPTVN